MKHSGYSFLRPGPFSLLLASFFLFSCHKQDLPSVAQKPYSFSIGYSKVLGGSGDESDRHINSPDGGIVMAATTSSTDGDVHGSHGKEDAWIVKLNGSGDTVWTRTLGGKGDDEAAAICATRDGGYIVTGSTDSEDGDITDKRPFFNKDVWVVKLDGNGRTVWSRTFGSFGFDAGYSVIGTSDGGYLIAGVAGSNNGDVAGYHGGGDVWVIKLDSQGFRQWAKVYGGSSWDEAHRIVAVSDGYVLAGLTNSSDGDVTGYHTATFIGADMLVIKIGFTGDKIWAKAFGGTNDEVATSLTAVFDGYVVGGYTSSNDGDVTGIHDPRVGFADMWVLKLSGSGTIVWAKTFGGSFDEAATSVASTPDGGVILAGAASSSDGDVTGIHTKDGNGDCWLVKLDAGGNKQWAKTLGGSDDDVAYSVTVNPDGYTVTGSTLSTDGDVGGTHRGQYDLWAVKLLVK